MVDDDGGDGARLDVWLDIACLFRTRSEAQKAVRAGKVSVNRQPTKPQPPFAPRRRVEISRPYGRKQRVRVSGFAGRHVARAEARALYEDLDAAPARLKKLRRAGSNGCIARR